MQKELFDNNEKRGAIVSPCGQYRYALWRIWDDSKKIALWIMCNPSDADHVNDDPTTRRVRGFTMDHGFGGFYIGNCYALRTGGSEGWQKKFMAAEDPIGPEYHQSMAMMLLSTQVHILACGAFPFVRKRLTDLAEMIPDALCLGVTQEGYPRHPLYVSSSTKLVRYAVNQKAVVVN